MLFRYVEMQSAETGKSVFLFSTIGQGANGMHTALNEKLADRGFTIAGEFSCGAWDRWVRLKLVGGINKGRPDDDLAGARVCARV